MAETRHGGFTNRPRFPGGGNPSNRGAGGGNQTQGGGGQGTEWPPKYQYQQGYFFDEKGNLKESLVTSFAEEQAKSFVQQRLNSSQLRKFYHEVKALEAKIQAGGFEQNFPFVQMLRSKIAYACPRDFKSRKIPEPFARFLWQHVANVKTQKEFNAFSTVFEAMVGFFYGQGGK